MERNKPTPAKLIHTYDYKPSETQFFCSKDEKDNENNLFLGIELEISGSTKESDNEEDARKILKIIQEDAMKAAPISAITKLKIIVSTS